ncbi:MAG TPA: NmrA family NAD(P)-binding protein, partial [Myxococcaceae bacterium]|nr:NmrA family NAD(P)-binding protein [Myxococcaceae bacterium]
MPELSGCVPPTTRSSTKDDSWACHNLQLITVEDIGRFCARVFEQREAFLGRRIDLAGDSLDGWETAAVLSRVLRREIRPVALPLASFPAHDELSRNTATLLAWLADTGFSADIEGLRRQYP